MLSSSETPGLPEQERDDAIRVQAWYLINLLLLPGIGLLVLLYYRARFQRLETTRLARDAVQKSIIMSLLGGALILLGCGSMLLIGGNTGATWMTLILYFTVLHSIFVLWGILGLARVMAGKRVSYWGV